MAERDPAEILLWRLTLVRLIGLGLAVLGLWLAGAEPLGGISRYLALAAMLGGAALVIFAARLFDRP